MYDFAEAKSRALERIEQPNMIYGDKHIINVHATHIYIYDFAKLISRALELIE